MEENLAWALGVVTLRRSNETTLSFHSLYHGFVPSGERGTPEYHAALAKAGIQNKNFRFGVHYLEGNRTLNLEEGHPIQLEESTDNPLDPWCERRLALVVADLDQDPSSVEDVYLRLTMMSARDIPAETVSGLWSMLPVVAWTNHGPIATTDLEAARRQLLLRGQFLTPTCIDKIPHMLGFVNPPGIRVADAARVRLGAQLGPGTTVMQAGFVNACATVGEGCMIEGRVSFGTRVGNNTDLGGGSSMQGTLSGGGQVRVTVGRNCLIGANAGTGICLGHGCTIAAGLYVSPGLSFFDTRKTVKGKPNATHLRWVAASSVSGQDRMLFVQSRTGRLEIRHNKNPNKMNEELHSND